MNNSKSSRVSILIISVLLLGLAPSVAYASYTFNSQFTSLVHAHSLKTIIKKSTTKKSTRKRIVKKTVPVIKKPSVVAPPRINPLTAPAPIYVPSNIKVPSVLDGKYYSIDQTGPGGGTVFYYSSNAFTEGGATCDKNCHYLEFAPITWFGRPSLYPNFFNAGIPSFTWATDTFNPSAASGIVIGTGFSNTKAMLTSFGSYQGDSTGVAYQVNLYAGSDSSQGQWFIPSDNELQELSNSLHFKALFNDGGLTLWSSTDAESWDVYHKTGSVYAMFHGFGKYAQDSLGLKTYTHGVLPIRAF